MRLMNLNNDVGLGFNQRIFQVLGRVLDTGGRVEVVAGAVARVEVVARAKGIARAVIYLPIM